MRPGQPRGQQVGGHRQARARVQQALARAWRGCPRSPTSTAPSGCGAGPSRPWRRCCRPASRAAPRHHTLSCVVPPSSRATESNWPVTGSDERAGGGRVPRVRRAGRAVDPRQQVTGPYGGRAPRQQADQRGRREQHPDTHQDDEPAPASGHDSPYVSERAGRSPRTGARGPAAQGCLRGRAGTAAATAWTPAPPRAAGPRAAASTGRAAAHGPAARRPPHRRRGCPAPASAR